jgi:hypothetical protein
MHLIRIRLLCFHIFGVIKIALVGAWTTLRSLFGRVALLLVVLSLLGIMPLGIDAFVAPVLLALLGAVVALWRIVPVYVSVLQQGEDVAIGADQAGLPILRNTDLG